LQSQSGQFPSAADPSKAGGMRWDIPFLNLPP
jgi:hypothetical protein